MESPSTGLMSQPSESVAGAVTPERAAYYDRIGKKNLAPLWEVLKGLVPPEPKTPCVPALWRFSDVKKMVIEAGQLITAKEAERRVLVFENPALRGRSRITQSLYAGLQLILPGEIAPAHRHTASAIRFVLDGEGAYTAVEGEKTIMRRGDFVITANWAPHDHGNPSKQPMIWLDVLDVPTVNFFDAAFSEHLEMESQSNTKEDGDSYARYGSGRAARRREVDAAQPDHQLSLCRDPAGARAPGGFRRYRSAPRRARALRQSAHRRLGDADHGRQHRDVPQRLQGQGLSGDRRRDLRLRRRRGLDQDRGRDLRLGPERRLRHSLLEALRAHDEEQDRSYSRSPTGRRRKRSASGASRTDAARP